MHACNPAALLQVRANSLQELVYKQGQAGITKATVSIVFDNREKERGPVRGRAGRGCALTAAARLCGEGRGVAAAAGLC